MAGLRGLMQAALISYTYTSGVDYVTCYTLRMVSFVFATHRIVVGQLEIHAEWKGT